MSALIRTAGMVGGLAVMAMLSERASAAASSEEDCSTPPPAALVVDVRAKGAKGDGKTDDTAAIQAAIDAVAGSGGTVRVPDGTYLVSATKKRLRLKSSMTLEMSAGATLKAKPTSKGYHAILTIEGASNVVVTGGTLEGERDQHLGTEGEWGVGIRIAKGSRDITVSNVTARKMWGDGFLIRQARAIKLCGVTADENRRQGLSIVEASQVLVTGSTFKNTSGTRPAAGIDLEPDHSGQRIVGIRIERSRFFDNQGGGIVIAGKKGRIALVEIKDNLFSGNRPVLIENSPAVSLTSICRNRMVTRRSGTSGGLSPFDDAAKETIVQDECGDSRFIVRRTTKRKSKSGAN